MMDAICRTVCDRQRISRETRAGREYHVNRIVPMTRVVRLVVIICKGDRAKIIQKGVTKSIRINSVVREDLVLAEVAVCCVERKSVSCMNGSRSVLQRKVNSDRVSTISSKLF